MLFRRFGRTNLQIPVFSCGGMRFQHKWQDVPLKQVPADEQKRLEATVRRALELGINHIETARGYGSSERQLGKILPKLPRERLIVQTKIMPTRDAPQFRADFLDSLARLKLDYVDLLAIHGVNNFELLHWSTRAGGCLAEARRLVREGKACHVGFSTHGPCEVIQAAIETERDGGFDYVNLHWYYIFQQNWPAIEAATRREMGVFIISPSDKGGMLYRPPAKLVRLCKPLHPLVFNALFCLRRPEVHTLSIGAARPEDFDLALSALPLLARADELLPPIVARLTAAMHSAVGRDVAERFAEGLPAWSDTPGNMNLSLMLWLRNLLQGYGLEEYAKFRYNLLGNAAHWFPGMSAAQLDEYDLTKALAKSPFKEQIPRWLRQLHKRLYLEPSKRLSEGG